MNSIDRALSATGSKSDSELARFLGLAQSSVSGFRKRGWLPLEQYIKVAEQTDTPLDWLILGKGEAKAAALPPEEQMLITGWRALAADKQDYVFDLLRRLARGEAPEKAGVSVGGDAGQVVAGNADIGTLTIGTGRRKK